LVKKCRLPFSQSCPILGLFISIPLNHDLQLLNPAIAIPNPLLKPHGSNASGNAHPPPHAVPRAPPRTPGPTASLLPIHPATTTPARLLPQPFLLHPSTSSGSFLHHHHRGSDPFLVLIPAHTTRTPDPTAPTPGSRAIHPLHPRTAYVYDVAGTVQSRDGRG
jgi:hypothetical protein